MNGDIHPEPLFGQRLVGPILVDGRDRSIEGCTQRFTSWAQGNIGGTQAKYAACKGWASKDKRTCGLASMTTEPSGLVISRIAIPSVVAVPRHHRLARRAVIAPKDLAGERIVGLLAGSLFRSRLDVALAGLGCNIFIETQLSHTACLLVAEGAGIGIVDPYAALELEGRGLVIRRFSVALDSGFLCVRSERQPASVLATSFADEFDAHIRELMAPFDAKVNSAHLQKQAAAAEAGAATFPLCGGRITSGNFRFLTIPTVKR